MATPALLRPHDLLEAREPAAIVPEAPAPAWVGAVLARAPLVVVRRHPPTADAVPVGLRGDSRDARWAGWLATGAVARCIAPEDLSRSRLWQASPRSGELPHFSVLAAIHAALDGQDLAWGPTGSAGFELASGQPCLRPDSDIDLVIRADQGLPMERATDLATRFAGAEVRIDAQIDTALGTVALVEYARRPASILVRTPAGPRLIDNPWRDR
jgi:phosphoribosyl-dephospho-CoA transferase